MPWLMKAEPDTRIVKGKDVKFSVDDLEEIGVSPWDGVRSHEAKNIMKEKMKLGDPVLFYHSNCKTPGVYGLAEVEKEGYPDYTAWDPSHPYYDPKSLEDKPTWFMVSVKFIRRLEHPVTLAFIKSLVGLAAPPVGIEYIGDKGLKALQSMALVNRGRLSVQPVEKDAYETIVSLGDRGGWDEASVGKKPPKAKPTTSADKDKKRKGKNDTDEDEDNSREEEPKKAKNKTTVEKKTEEKQKTEGNPKAATKPKAEPKPAVEGTRRSSRIRK